MIKRSLKKIRKWYQSQFTCLKPKETYQEIWQHILEQAELANTVWYTEATPATPARESLSQQSDG